MLSTEENGMKVKCRKCQEVMKKRILDSYEYVEGFQLYGVPAFQCEKCCNLYFTENMVEQMEKRTKLLKMKSFGFRRSLAVSGRGLVVRIPADLIRHLDLKEGESVSILPVDHQGSL